MLRIENLHSGYGKIEVLKGLHLRLKEGEITAVIGANGAGKTTLLKTICGLLAAWSGKIIYQDAQIQGLTAHEIVNKKIVCVPEARRIFSRLTVEENLLLGAFTQKDSRKVQLALRKAYSLFPVLKERRSQIGQTLSGGEQQMLAIARGLMSEPRLLLLDEPSMGLAPIVIEKIFSAIKKLKKEGMTILLVEQNANLALRVCERGIVMDVGRIVLEDKGVNLLANEMVRKSYIGE